MSNGAEPCKTSSETCLTRPHPPPKFHISITNEHRFDPIKPGLCIGIRIPHLSSSTLSAGTYRNGGADDGAEA